MKKYVKLFIVLLSSALLTEFAWAERADKDKPIHIESDHATVENASLTEAVQRISVFTGSVLFTQGTLIIHSDKMILRENASGLQSATAYGNLASYRQKREGLNEYIEGWSERMEYDTKINKIDFFKQARLKRTQDQVHGEHISYNTDTEFFQVNNKEEANVKSNKRVRAVIQPKK
ncbi:MAG: lipopolysaccharide transport periplasmic protein LptA [Nitrosomonadaceae bacterium]|nr:lipopolysaccharide transport periplasmic protein LptA [Nitrosospira sp.]MDW7642321.1 lipopolysaccharide transport periplasmic protein LptA [Nitrosomonadaceae bacterium]MDW7653590.1 lipopolysaccharide transport periplasmic protein LptA [Nitrosomonadaceae bacterium]MDW7663273.1 lipopolysaccharide transport periplasmic protein LptA [Nitrosomonadaceae bacterium]MDW7665256.1 lipopolysaccharide transport periplasmic protein LptA [Nitrosomonadaceae bacterium]